MGLKKKSKISGKIYFTAPSGTGTRIPAANIECGIRIYRTAGGDQRKTFLETFYTNSDGNFSVTVKLGETEDVIIEMRTHMNGNYPIKLYKAGSLKNFKYLSEKKHIKHGQDYSNYEIDIDAINEPANKTLGYDKELFIDSLSIMMAGRFAYQYLNDKMSCKISKTPVIYYPADTDVSYDVGKYMHITPSKNFSYTINSVLHEFGHFVAYSLGFINASISIGNHSSSTNKAEGTNNKLHGMNFAWNEGFAEFFSFYMYDRNPDFAKFFGTGYSYSVNSNNLTGESNEASVERFLSLATFSSNEVGKQFVTDIQLWDALRTDKPKRIDDCIKALQKKNNDRNLLGKILSMSRIAPYDLSRKKDCITFPNAGTQHKLTKLNEFVFNIKTSKQSSFTKYKATLKNLVESSNMVCKYTLNSSILDRINKGEGLEVYIDGYQTERLDSGPYTSELYTEKGTTPPTTTGSTDPTGPTPPPPPAPTVSKLKIHVHTLNGNDGRPVFLTIKDKQGNRNSYKLDHKGNIFVRNQGDDFDVSLNGSKKVEDLKEFEISCDFRTNVPDLKLKNIKITDASKNIILAAPGGEYTIKKNKPLVIPVNANELVKKYK